MLNAFSLPPLLAHLIELTIFALVAVIALGVGLRLLWLIRAVSSLGMGEKIVFGLTLGAGALSFAMLAMGLLGILYLPVGLVVLAALALTGRRFLWGIYEEIGPATVFRRTLDGLRYPPNLFLALVIALAVGAALAKALVPVATQDDLMYHLALPGRYIEAHAIQFYPDSTYSLFPQAMEMLYTWGLLLGSDRLSMLFAFGMGLLGPAAAALFARRWLVADKQGVWRALPLLVAAIFLTTPLVGYILRAANTDLAQASFDLLTVYALWLFFFSRIDYIERLPQEGETPPGFPQDAKFMILEKTQSNGNYGLLILAGLCAGLAFSTKYYGLFIGAFIGPLWLMLDLRGKKPGAALREWGKRIAAFGIPFACLAGVWLVRNLIEAGNPLWPLAGAFFKGAYWSPDAPPAALLGSIPTPGLATIPTALADLWYAWTRGPLLIDGQTHAVDLGPILLLSLATLFFVRWRERSALLIIAISAFWYLGMWALLFSHTSARYLSTFFLFAALMGGYGLVALMSRWRVARWGVGVAIVCALALLAIQAAWSAGPYLPTVVALDSSAEEAYLAQYMEDYPIMLYIRDHTQPDAVIYVWDGQPRGYYIPRSYVYARLVPLYSGFGQPPETWRNRLREPGITHILVHDRDRLAPGQPTGQDPFAQAAQAFQSRYFGPEETHAGTYTLYPLKP